MELRTFQGEILDIADRLIAGTRENRDVVLDCTPGGGKTGAGILFAKRLLDARMIDQVLWLVPRASLSGQVVDSFASKFGGGGNRILIAADGKTDLHQKGLPGTPTIVGFVATYQLISQQKHRNADRFRRWVDQGRTLVVFDEVQFLYDSGTPDNEQAGWNRWGARVKRAAAYNLLMTGTLWRTDGNKIPGVQYEQREDGLLYPLCDVSYTLRQAVADRSVLPTEWINRSGTVQYEDTLGVQTSDLLEDPPEDATVSKQIRTFLADEVACYSILDAMVEHWLGFRSRVYESRMLVIADSIQSAKKWHHYMKERRKIASVLVTSDDASAGRALKRFQRRSNGMCLVTIGMAYVGFDCPDLTHLAYLSNTRATSWMLQSFARVSRYDTAAPVKYESQHAYVFAPDDSHMRRFCAWLRSQIDMGIADRQPRGRGEGRPKLEVVSPDHFVPIAATPGELAVESLAGRLSPKQEKVIAKFKETCPGASGLSHSALHEILTKTGYYEAHSDDTPS